MAEFLGRPVSRETISLGLGGQIDRAGEQFPPLSLVTFKATAKVSSIKHKFLGDGTVEEMLILVIDPESFRVVDIHEERDGQERLPLAGATQ